MKQWAKHPGFTIVELLIVIVVIAILAAITIVAYTGITTRADFSSMRSDVTTIQKAVELYYAENGAYPGISGNTAWRCSGSYPTDFVPNVSSYIAALPNAPAGGGSYCYRTNTAGTDYKIIRLYQPAIPSAEAALVPSSMVDPVVPADRWGVWTPGGVNF